MVCVKVFDQLHTHIFVEFQNEQDPMSYLPLVKLLGRNVNTATPARAPTGDVGPTGKALAAPTCSTNVNVGPTCEANTTCTAVLLAHLHMMHNDMEDDD